MKIPAKSDAIFTARFLLFSKFFSLTASFSLISAWNLSHLNEFPKITTLSDRLTQICQPNPIRNMFIIIWMKRLCFTFMNQKVNKILWSETFNMRDLTYSDVLSQYDLYNRLSLREQARARPFYPRQRCRIWTPLMFLSGVKDRGLLPQSALYTFQLCFVFWFLCSEGWLIPFLLLCLILLEVKPINYYKTKRFLYDSLRFWSFTNKIPKFAGFNSNSPNYYFRG